MVNSKSKQLIVNKFNTGLNITDDPLSLQNTDLVLADNVYFGQGGEVRSINSPSQVGENIVVDGSPATKFLGIKEFNGKIYALISNNTVSRLMYTSGIIGSSGNWAEANSQNFDPTAKADFEVYANKLWIVNGKTTNGKVLSFLSTSNVLTGLTTAECGLPEGINHIKIHLERIWISFNNTLYVTIQYPTGDSGDWDSSTVYTGANTAGYIIIDDNTNDYIQGLETLFSQLIIYRRYSIFLVTGNEILSSTITKKTNAKNGVLAPRSIAKADNVVYFLGDDGVKLFNGTTIQEQTTQLDTLITQTYDRNISEYIQSASKENRIEFCGIAHKDKYYLSDPNSETIYVLDEFATMYNPIKLPVWSRWVNHKAEVFLEFGGDLYCAKANQCFVVNRSLSLDLTSQIKTKDFDMEDKVFDKLFESVKIVFRTNSNANQITFKWYINGAIGEAGSETINISKSGVVYNSGLKYNQGIKYNSAVITFSEYTKRKLLSGKSISFGIKAEGANRFILSSLSVIYETTRRGG